MKIVNTKEEHISQLVNLHEKMFPDSMSTSLGTNYLKKSYQAKLRNHKYKSLVAIDKGVICGYIFLIKRDDEIGSVSVEIDSNKVVIIQSLLRNPRILLKHSFLFKIKDILINRLRNTTKMAHLVDNSVASYGLVVIATDRSIQGIGKALLDKTKELLENQNGLNQIKINLSVNCSNINAINFYFRNGFRITKHKGKSYSMMFELNNV